MRKEMTPFGSYEYVPDDIDPLSGNNWMAQQLIESKLRENDFKTDLSPENTHGGKRVNAGRKVSLLGKSDNHTVTLHQKQDEYLRNKFGTLSKALKSLLPKKLQ